MQEHLAFLVEDADVHGPCVQVDSAVVFVRLRVESHCSLLFRRWLVLTLLPSCLSPWGSRRGPV